MPFSYTSSLSFQLLSTWSSSVSVSANLVQTPSQSVTYAQWRDPVSDRDPEACSVLTLVETALVSSLLKGVLIHRLS